MMSFRRRPRGKPNRGQGALEYLIILGAAVLIAVVVVGKMMGILGGQSKKMEKNVCIHFIQGLCQALVNPATSSATDNAATAITNFLGNNLYDQNISRIKCTVASATSVSCDSGVFEVGFNTLNATIGITTPSEYVFVHGTKVYFAKTPISGNDFACWGNVTTTTNLKLNFYATGTINCNQITAAA